MRHKNLHTSLAVFAVLPLPLLLAGAFTLGQQPPAEKLPSGEAILDKFIDATGGKAAYLRLANSHSQGTFEVTGTRLRGTITVYEKAPDNSRSILDIEGVEKVEEGTFGGVAWEKSGSQGPRLKEGEEKAVALREAVFSSKLHWRKLYTKVERVGIETVGDRTCYKVVLTPPVGKAVNHFYDRESSLLLKSTILLDTPGGEIPSENYYGDYKEVQSVLFPHRLIHKVKGEETVVMLDSVECNIQMPWYRFNPPADVKALIARSIR